MSNAFTLDDLRAEIEQKYAPLVFRAGDEEFSLRPILRLSKTAREAVISRLKELDEAGEDADEDTTVGAMKYVLEVVTDRGQGRRLVEVLGDELVLLSTLMEKWMEATQVGEAKDSPS